VNYGLTGLAPEGPMARGGTMDPSTRATVPAEARWLRPTGVAISALLLAVPFATRAWIWPEHRDIAAEAIREMPASQRKVLDGMWAALRTDSGTQLCATLVNPGAQPSTPRGEWDKVCVDFPSYPALAGDHSCTTAQLKEAAEMELWARKVVWVAARTKEKLAEDGQSPQRGDDWNRSHLAMQYVDPKYLTRAEGNNAHFLIPRAEVQDRETLEMYLDRSLAADAPVNATAMYAKFHALALRLGALYGAAPVAARPDLARRALLAEGVALHFLEDSYSSGHYASTWGTAPWQKGTHDLYSVKGLTTMTWGGELFASHGDANMTERDGEVAAASVRKSLMQLAAAASGEMPVASGPLNPQEQAVESVDFCNVSNLPSLSMEPAIRTGVVKVLQDSPIPSGDQKSIHPPRARADIGPFAGVVAGITFGPAFAGYDTNGGFRWRSELEVGARFGYGLEGVLTTNMDGQIWAQASFVNDPAQLDASCPDCPGGKRTNKAVPRVPGRSGLKLVFRMPYYVVPFDMLLLAPVLLLTSPDAAQSVVFTAASGGLWTIQRPISTGIGTFQFMAGRELGITLWGSEQWISNAATPVSIVEYKSIELDFPVWEYTPPRAFATTLALAAEVQLGFSVEFPNNAVVVYPATNAPFDNLGTSWFIYLRLRLDARKYFGGASEDWQN
jgi:hypothetical protein